MMKDYKVAIGKGVEDFEEQVNLVLRRCYTLVGGVQVQIVNGELWFFQAVIRKSSTRGLGQPHISISQDTILTNS